jgi:hypothetical protein
MDTLRTAPIEGPRVQKTTLEQLKDTLRDREEKEEKKEKKEKFDRTVWASDAVQLRVKRFEDPAEHFEIEDLADFYIEEKNIRASYTLDKEATSRKAEVEPDFRNEALAEIIKYRASMIPAVHDFRKRWLRKGFISTDGGVEEWLRRRASREHVDQGGIRYPDPFYNPLEDTDAVFQVKLGGSIHSLFLTAESLARSFEPAIQLEEAIVFLLTDQLHFPLIVMILRKNYLYGALSRFVMEIDPRQSPREVAEAYRRTGYAGKQGNRQEKNIELACFVDRYHESEKDWRTLIPKWNAFWKKKNPESRGYPETRQGQTHIGRDARDSWQAVTGADWSRREYINRRIESTDPFWEYGQKIKE